MKNILFRVLFCIFVFCLSAGRNAYAGKILSKVTFQNLTCEYLTNPLGIDKQYPVLSWNIKTDKRNWHQYAYQIIVSSEVTLLKKGTGDVWNSGKVISSENIQVIYRGVLLQSFMNCYWKVKVWDNNGIESDWSPPAYWKMGVLSPSDWKGKWICSDLKLKDYQIALRALPDFAMESDAEIWKRADSIRKNVHPADTAPAVYIRKEFNLNKTIKRATAYVCGLGLNELFMNGLRIDKQYLNPAFTDYQKRVLYNIYDVTNYAKRGANALGVILGNGWYNLIVPHALRFYSADYIDPPKLLMQLYIEYNDSSTRIIATDSTWKFTTNGPITYNGILSGETYDARKEMHGWELPGYSDTAWLVSKMAIPPQGMLKAQLLDPVRKLDSFSAVKLEKTEKGFHFDMGRELCGWVSIKLRGRKGQKVKVYYPGAPSHTLGRYQTCYFILKGDGEEVFEPNFSYNGYRYIEVEGLDYTPALSDVKGFLVATDLRPVGIFSCSNEKLNEIQKILLNTIRNYIVHIPNDPTREKSGWTQDVETGFDVNAYNFDVARMYIKWQHDFNDAVYSNGYIPPVVPGRFAGPTINGPWWGGMIIYNVAKLYSYYGDIGIIKESYESMRKYMGYLTSISKNNIIDWGLGEWMEPYRISEDPRPVNTPVALTSTVAYYYYAHTMTFFAKMLHKDSDAQYFKNLSVSIKRSFNKSFLNGQTGQYSIGSQAGQLMPLHFGLVPSDKRELVISKLIEFIKKRNGHLSTGFVATPILLTTLDDIGLSDKAYTMATKRDFPGWFDMIFNRGNSVMMENWKGGGVQMPSLGGPIGYWFYYSLAGIKPALPAFKSIVIKPFLSDSLSWVSASYQSIQGRISSKWQRRNNRCFLQVKIPANTKALVYLPTANTSNISEGNKKIKLNPDVKIIRITRKETIVSIGSGTYSFVVKL